MQSPGPRLRAMALTEILDAAFRLYRDNFQEFLIIIAILAGPVAILTAIVNAAMAASATRLVASAENPLGALAVVSGALAVGGVLSIISFIASLVASGALAYAISRRYLGKPITVAGAYDAIKPRMGTLIITSIVVGAIVGVVAFSGVFLLVIGVIITVPIAVWLGIRWAFVTQTVVIENHTMGSAMSRSRSLVTGSWWRVFGVIVVAGIIMAVVTGIIAAIVNGILGAILPYGAVETFITSLVSSALTIAGTPFTLTTLTLLYFDQRIRKEGFDLEVMARELGEGGAPQTEIA